MFDNLYEKLVEERDLILTIVSKKVQVDSYPFDSVVRCYQLQHDISIQYKEQFVCSYRISYPNHINTIRLWNRSGELLRPCVVDVDIDISLYKEDIDYRFQVGTCYSLDYIQMVLVLDIYQEVYRIININVSISVDERIGVYKEILEKYCE